MPIATALLAKEVSSSILDRTRMTSFNVAGAFVGIKREEGASAPNQINPCHAGGIKALPCTLQSISSVHSSLSFLALQ